MGFRFNDFNIKSHCKLRLFNLNKQILLIKNKKLYLVKIKSFENQLFRSFREYITHQLEMPAQQKILDNTIEDWIKQGNEKQIDDILIVGIKI